MTSDIAYQLIRLLSYFVLVMSLSFSLNHGPRNELKISGFNKGKRLFIFKGNFESQNQILYKYRYIFRPYGHFFNSNYGKYKGNYVIYKMFSGNVILILTIQIKISFSHLLYFLFNS